MAQAWFVYIKLMYNVWPSIFSGWTSERAAAAAYMLGAAAMLRRLGRAMWDWFFPPPVTWEQIITVVGEIEEIDSQIEQLKFQQSRVSDVYYFARIDSDISERMQARSKLGRLRRSLVRRARSQAPTVDYERML